MCILRLILTIAILGVGDGEVVRSRKESMVKCNQRKDCYGKVSSHRDQDSNNSNNKNSNNNNNDSIKVWQPVAE